MLQRPANHRCQIDCTNHDEVINALELKSKDLYYFWVTPTSSSATTNGSTIAITLNCSASRNHLNQKLSTSKKIMTSAIARLKTWKARTNN